MNNIYINTILLIVIFVFTSCENDFLQEDPIANLNSQTFFKSEKDFRQATNSIYSNLQPLAGGTNEGTGTGGFWAMSELRSDNSTYQYNTVDLSGHFSWYLDNFIMATTNPVIQNFWETAYEGIGKANIVISKSMDIDYKNKSEIVGEAKYLRALYYSYLVRYFGNIPLVLEPASSYEEAFKNNIQVAKENVYELIIDDLNEAKGNLPLLYSSLDQGKATSGAARTLLATVLMELGRFEEAQIELEEVRNSKVYSLMTEYKDVFGIENENNSEIIFSVQFIEGTFGLTSMYMYLFAPWNAKSDLLGYSQQTSRTGMNIPTADLVDSFEEGDLRKKLIDLSFTDNLNWTYSNSIVPINKKYWHKGHAVQFQTATDFILHRYPHVLLMLAECYMETGGGDPVPLVNQVRNRAGLPSKPSYTIDEILDERRFEFYGEADRWDVLVRRNLVFEIMEKHGEAERNTRPELHVGDAAFRNLKVLYPIPARAIQIDPTLIQNSGY